MPSARRIIVVPRADVLMFAMGVTVLRTRIAVVVLSATRQHPPVFRMEFAVRIVRMVNGVRMMMFVRTVIAEKSMGGEKMYVSPTRSSLIMGRLVHRIRNVNLITVL